MKKVIGLWVVVVITLLWNGGDGGNTAHLSMLCRQGEQEIYRLYRLAH